MSGSRTIRVLKCDGRGEEFDGRKLALAIWRAMGAQKQMYALANYLSDAVQFYLTRSGRRCVSSAAVFEMCVRLLQHMQDHAAAKRMQEHRSRREALRRELRIRHERGRLTLWEKSWLAQFAQRCWHLSTTTARILAGQVEADLLADTRREFSRTDPPRDRLTDGVSHRDTQHTDAPRRQNASDDLPREKVQKVRTREIPRQEIIDRLNALTAAYGLADAVPVTR